MVLLALAYAFTALLRDDMFWPSQVIRRWGRAGIALVFHGGLWGDLFVLPMLSWLLITWYQDVWQLSDLKWSALMGFVLTAGNHVNLCLNQRVPDPFGWREERWSATIGLHFLYMWLASTVLFQTAFFTPHLTSGVVSTVCIIVGLHMMCGIHMPVGIVNRALRDKRIPEFLRADSLWMATCIWVAMTLLALVLGGTGAMVSVACATFACVTMISFIMQTSSPVES
jgi:hypothetical protein